MFPRSYFNDRNALTDQNNGRGNSCKLVRVRNQKFVSVGDRVECLELFTRPCNKVSTRVNLRAIKVATVGQVSPAPDSNGLNLSWANTVLTGRNSSARKLAIGMGEGGGGRVREGGVWFGRKTCRFEICAFEVKFQTVDSSNANEPGSHGR